MNISKTYGFTLVEMMIALSLASMVMIAMFTTFRSQERSYQSQEEIVDMQQTLRAGISLLTDDLHMAGYDPDGHFNLGFTRAEKDVIEFSMISDWDGIDNTKDGTVDEVDERNIIQYSLYNDSDSPGLDNLGRKADNYAYRVKTIEHVSHNKLRFAYTLRDGSGPLTNVPVSKLNEIVKVHVYILVESARQIHQLQQLNSYEVPNGSGETTNWTVTGRHIFIEKSVYCRNMAY
ncbi:MAG: prepilin-type N-terminal cleavage/methylation domain-containing protein [Desulfobulbaceae bacterium]|nr:prepilin-type N-terminal cleavage/methylation domain-containing protein [Desulfobulbaceae bacterium]